MPTKNISLITINAIIVTKYGTELSGYNFKCLNVFQKIVTCVNDM